MHYIFFKNLAGKYASVLLLLCLIAVFSCKTPNELIRSDDFNFGNNTNVEKRLDSLVGVFINSRPNGYFNKMGVSLISSDLRNWESNNLYVGRLASVTDVYAHPITGYFMHNDILVVYYDKKVGYSNPICYPPKFVYDIKLKISNDWDYVKSDCNGEYVTPDGFIMDHSPYFLFDGQTFKKANKFDFGKIVYNKRRYNYLLEVDFENFRIVYKHCN